MSTWSSSGAVVPRSSEITCVQALKCKLRTQIRKRPLRLTILMLTDCAKKFSLHLDNILDHMCAETIRKVSQTLKHHCM